jgi:hypothetical protein
MEQKEYLDKLGLPSVKYPEEKFNELKEQFLEMSQLKSDFDIEKFTVKKEGNFIAHNFHFLMRQYSLTLFELRRFVLERDEKLREIEEYEGLIGKEIKKTSDGKYPDIEIKKKLNEIDSLDLNIANKAISVDRFEKARLKIIELNGGKVPTNSQYQKEEPQYWAWFLEMKAINQHKQAKTGIHEGTWENIDLLENDALINPEYKVRMLDDNGFLDLKKAKNLIEKGKGYPERVELK